MRCVCSRTMEALTRSRPSPTTLSQRMTTIRVPWAERTRCSGGVVRARTGRQHSRSSAVATSACRVVALRYLDRPCDAPDALGPGARCSTPSFPRLRFAVVWPTADHAARGHREHFPGAWDYPASRSGNLAAALIATSGRARSSAGNQWSRPRRGWRSDCMVPAPGPAVIGGLITSTPHTLLVIPTLYRWIADRGAPARKVSP